MAFKHHPKQSKPHQDSNPDSKTPKTLSQLTEKRPAAETEENKLSKKKTKTTISNGAEKGSEIDDKKASLFTRLFSENDEIVLLQGMIDFKFDPISNPVEFQECVKDLLSCNFTKTQILNKIKRLKKKFLNNVKRGGKKNGEDPVFSRPHEYKSFELSKKIWVSDGSQVGDGDSKVKSSNKKKNGNVVSNTPSKSVKDKIEGVETKDCWSIYPFLCASLEYEAIKYLTTPMCPEKYVKQVVSGLEREKAAELEMEWKGYDVMEHQLYVKKVELISKQTEAVMEVIQP